MSYMECLEVFDLNKDGKEEMVFGGERLKDNLRYLNSFSLLKNGIKSLRSWRRAELSSCEAG
jgi:hypothetical protein